MIREATPISRWTEEAAEDEAARHRLATTTLPGAQTEANVGAGERVMSVVLGAVAAGLALSGITRTRSVSGCWRTSPPRASGMLLCAVSPATAPPMKALNVRSDDAEPASHPLSRHVHLQYSVTINRSAEELYDQWRQFEQLPRILNQLEKIEWLDDRRQRWTVTGPNDQLMTWEAEITEDVPGERIAWATLPDSDLATTSVPYASSRPAFAARP